MKWNDRLGGALLARLKKKKERARKSCSGVGGEGAGLGREGSRGSAGFCGWGVGGGRGSSHFLSPGQRLQGKTSEQGGEASGLRPDVRMASLVPRQITQLLTCDRAVTLHPGIDLEPEGVCDTATIESQASCLWAQSSPPSPASLGTMALLPAWCKSLPRAGLWALRSLSSRPSIT